MKKTKENLGITLIALVITIIVLLILAGVSIAMLTGNNGILNQAKLAKENTIVAKEDESNKLSTYETQISDYSGVIDWESAKKNAIAPEEQKEERNNNVIGLGTDGKPVNMDLWEYTKLSDGTYGLNDESSLAENGTRTAGYNTNYIESGKIKGTIPQYIKGNGDIEFIPVTNINYLFFNTNLIKSPKIPNTVVSMRATFNSCSSLISMPEIPNGVENMYGTFTNCSHLVNTVSIPNTVTNMYGTFSGCSSLVYAPKLSENTSIMTSTFKDCSSLKIAPEIPNKVTNMYTTFAECTSLTTASTIPNSVTVLCATFKNCSNLQGILEINANVNGIQLGSEYFNNIDYNNCLLGASTNSGINLKLTGSCPVLSQIISNAKNSNITLK